MRALLDLVLPVHCAGCGRPGRAACADCLGELRAPPRVAWPRPSPPALPPPWTVAAYAGIPRALLLAYKEDGVVALRSPLSAALSAAVAAGLPPHHGGPALVVPVPSTRAARRQRGRDVVNDLAVAAAGRLRAGGVAARVVRGLRHSRTVADSAGLGAAARATNLSGAFTLRRGAERLVAGALVVVVDDLITTGTTSAECAQVLRAAGADVVAVATVAATARRAGPR